MKAAAGNRLLWVVLGVALVAMLGFSALSSQQQPAIKAQALSSQPTAAAAQGTDSAHTSAPDAQHPTSGTQDPSSRPFMVEYQDPQVQPAPNGILTVAGLIFKLAIVLGLIYLTVLGLRFVSNRGRAGLPSSGAITVLDKTALSQNRELYVIDVADKVLVLGATANSISVLSEITDAEAVEELRTRPQEAIPAAEPFLAYLKSVGEKVRPIAAEVASSPRELLKPADLVKRIEEHRRRLQASTASLQDSDPALEGGV
jgi:flagellar biogenesis protein FliO